jgi:hypothetical protein
MFIDFLNLATCVCVCVYQWYSFHPRASTFCLLCGTWGVRGLATCVLKLWQRFGVHTVAMLRVITPELQVLHRTTPLAFDRRS